MTTKILKKTTSAIFLAIVLIVGTFAAISPSFITGVNAQQYGMDQRYNSYQPEYGTDDNSYEQDYGKDNKYNSYEPEYEQTMEWTAMTRNHMEKTIATINPKIVVVPL